MAAVAQPSTQSTFRALTGATFLVNLHTDSSLGEGTPWGLEGNCWAGVGRGHLPSSLSTMPVSLITGSPDTSLHVQMTSGEAPSQPVQSAIHGENTGSPKTHWLRLCHMFPACPIGRPSTPARTSPSGRGYRGAPQPEWIALWACLPHPSTGITTGPCHTLSEGQSRVGAALPSLDPEGSHP